MAEPGNYIIYYFVLGLVLVFNLAGGQRSFCRYLCWMAPFVVIGRRIGDWLHLPGPRLQAAPDQCTGCRKCENACSMGLSVNSMVKAGNMEHTECIQCLACVDVCPSRAVTFRYGVKGTPKNQPHTRRETA